MGIVVSARLAEEDSETFERSIESSSVVFRYIVETDDTTYNAFQVYNDAVFNGFLPPVGKIDPGSGYGLRQVRVTRQPGEAAKYWIAQLIYSNEWEEFPDPQEHSPDEDQVIFTVDTVAELRPSLIDYRNVASAPKVQLAAKWPLWSAPQFYNAGDIVTYKGRIFQATAPSDMKHGAWNHQPGYQWGPAPDQADGNTVNSTEADLGFPLWQLWWREIKSEELPVEDGVDTSCKAAIARNTAGDTMSPVPEMFYAMRTLRIEFSRMTEGALGNYVATTNSDDVQIAGLRLYPYQGFFKNLRTTGPFYRMREGTPETAWVYNPYTKGANLVNFPNTEKYYRYTVEFEFFQVPKPCNVTILDPARQRRAADWDQPNGNNLVETMPLLYPGTDLVYDWVPYGDLSANVGFNAWFEEAKDSAAWALGTGYSVKDKVYTGSGDGHETYVCIAEHASTANDRPPNDAAGIAGGANWRDYWARANNGKWTKRQILWADLSGQMLANADQDIQDKAKEKVEQEVQLDRFGRVLEDQTAASGIYVLYFRKAQLASWAALPWFYSV